MSSDINIYIKLLKDLISTPSFSKEEHHTADLLASFLSSYGVPVSRESNNLWAMNLHFCDSKPTLLLNSHHDTVRPNGGYTRNPFEAEELDGRIYGLGSNDAGGSVVSLVAIFLRFYSCEYLKYNIVLALTAEEEISGTNGIESILGILPKIDLAIVGEPTMMQMAIAERGLMVLDCVSSGRSGHAAREEGKNAIYEAVQDIDWFRSFVFPKPSVLFGNIKMSVTQINAGTQHNVVPSECYFVVDIRVTEQYRNEDVLAIIKSNVSCSVTPCSTRLRSSHIPMEHTLVQAGLELGLTTYGSPTSSDAMLLKGTPTLKIGAGDSARSHTADEFIYRSDVELAITIYEQLLRKILF